MKYKKKADVFNAHADALEEIEAQRDRALEELHMLRLHIADKNATISAMGATRAKIDGELTSAIEKLERINRLKQTTTVENMAKVAANDPDSFRVILSAYMVDATDLKMALEEIERLKAERDTHVAVTERLKVALRIRGTGSYVEWPEYCSSAVDRAERAEAALSYVRKTLDEARPGMDDGAPTEAIVRKVVAALADAERRADRRKNDAVELFWIALCWLPRLWQGGAAAQQYSRDRATLERLAAAYINEPRVEFKEE